MFCLKLSSFAWDPVPGDEFRGPKGLVLEVVRTTSSVVWARRA